MPGDVLSVCSEKASLGRSICVRVLVENGPIMPDVSPEDSGARAGRQPAGLEFN